MARKVFIDLGAYDGDTLHEFFNWMTDADEWDVYAFEPNPRFYNHWKELCRDKYKNVTFMPQAAWIADEDVTFQQDPQELAWGSSLIAEKQGPANKKPIVVPAMDFSAWLNQFEGRHILIKMDIEGAEMPVLEKMIRDRTILLVNHIYIEFHGHKIDRNYEAREQGVKQNLKALGVSWSNWL